MGKVREQHGFERRLYRDGIHPSEAGNRLIPGAILETTQALYDVGIGLAGRIRPWGLESTTKDVQGTE
jgi:hypothetical protein